MKIHELFEHESLNELFNVPQKWHWGPEEYGSVATAYFSIIKNNEEYDYAVYFQKRDDDSPNEYNVSFALKKHNPDYNEYSKINNGFGFKVYATVIQVIEDFLNEWQPNVLEFTWEKSVDTIHKNMFKKLANRIPNWKLVERNFGIFLVPNL